MTTTRTAKRDRDRRLGPREAVRPQPRCDGVDLTAERGVTGLLGPNGAGKTTLLRMLATVLAPDTGELRLLGRDPADPASASRSAGASATCRRSRASTPASRPSSSSTTSPS